jgi:hypothetical protein
LPPIVAIPGEPARSRGVNAPDGNDAIISCASCTTNNETAHYVGTTDPEPAMVSFRVQGIASGGEE